MLHHQEPPHWVEERAKCNLELIFAALCQVLEHDVNEVNALPERQRYGQSFLFEVNVDGTMPMAQVNKEHETSNPDSQKAYATFRRSDRTITIQASSLPNNVVRAHVRWNAGARSCKLYLDETPYEVWELSQKVLGPMFFPN